MSDTVIDYYLTIISPWTYLGHEPFLAMAAAHGYQVAFKPVDFGQIFAQSGGLPLSQRPVQRRRYRMFELQRWRDYREAELNLRPEHFPTNPALGNGIVLMAAERGLGVGALAGAIMHACWVEDKDVGDRGTLIAIANGLDMDGAELVAAAESDDGKARVDALTKEAMAAQVFGAPTYVVRGEPFWGQDRLELVERALKGQAGPYTVEGAI